ncbi:hypothetical protein BP422_04780 [Brevibacillus formosus]|uniref:Uncharacterized protein n=1 Tax=Brevibacillus formosus TaxID=54913 RepID=A0A220MD41_9BACL|nr:hypothetical protein [Brevibacillus formosus]ASJ52927.1 hypothetical protein BP422_04780 [Brevibacillus formosus]
MKKGMVLYDGKHKVSEQEVLEKVRYFYNRANQGMEYWSQGDKRVALNLAKELRNALRYEYKNNYLKRIEQAYEDDHNFINF